MKKIRFDTRDKKPGSYGLLIATALAAAVYAAVVIAGKPWTNGALCVVTAVYALVCALLLFCSFREQLRYNPYSYNTIFYFGFGLFALFVTASHTVMAIRVFSAPELYSAAAVISGIIESAKSYMFYTSPFILVFSAGLCISNVSLIRHEGLRPVNLLGIALSVFLVAGPVFLLTFDFYVSGSQTEVMIHDMIVNLFASVYLYFECMIIGTIVADSITARYEPDKNMDFMIILGCGLQKDGTPTPLLRGRVERAVGFAREQKEQTGKDLVFITSGGKGDDEINSESAAMKRCLLENGVDGSLIIEEDRSSSTYENMKFSKEIIDKIDPSAKVAFSTTNYHVFRSGVTARRLSLRAVGIGAGTKWYYWPNAAVREFAGLLVNHKLKQAVILVSMIVFYVAMTAVLYSIY